MAMERLKGERTTLELAFILETVENRLREKSLTELMKTSAESVRPLSNDTRLGYKNV